MNDWLIGAVCVTAVFLAMVLGGVARLHDVGTDCEKVQAFRVGDKVYDCKERAK